MTLSLTGKINLYHACLQAIDKKNIELKLAIQDAQHSVNQETKSTAGDKHDTSRAMAQLEVENLSKQLQSIEANLNVLKKINPEHETSLIALGSLVETNSGIYFLSVGLGRFELANKHYFVISNQSPIGKLFIGKKIADEINFNQQKIKILNFI